MEKPKTTIIIIGDEPTHRWHAREIISKLGDDVEVVEEDPTPPCCGDGFLNPDYGNNLDITE